MYYRLIQLLILGYYLIHSTQSTFIFNLNNTEKLLCYSCKGSNCEKITNDNDDNMVICDKNTQLCWAGFVDQQAYRTCAGRFCTPSGISFDSDIRIETCCHSNLCNSVSLAWAVWSKWYRKSSVYPKTSASPLPLATTKRAIITSTTTTKKGSAPPRIYIVNEIVNNRRQPELVDNDEQQDSQLNANALANVGIKWEGVLYERSFSNRVVSISKLLVFLMSILLIF